MFTVFATGPSPGTGCLRPRRAARALRRVVPPRASFYSAPEPWELLLSPSRATRAMASKRGSHGGHAKASEPGSEVSVQRRAYVRFATMCRVDYEAAGKPTFSFTRDLSSHGMFLREAKQLAAEAQVTFRVHLDAGTPPAALKGVVRYTSAEGA